MDRARAGFAHAVRGAVIAIAFALCVIPLLSQHAHADTTDVFEYSVSGGQAEITRCDKAVSGNVVIPATRDGYPVTRIGDSALSGCTGIVELELPPTVTQIGDNAFKFCTGLTSVSLPSALASIGANAFSSCYNLTQIVIPNSVENIAHHAFANCTRLSSVSIPASVKSIGDWAFYNCTSLGRVEIPSSVTSIGDYAFSDCECLTSVAIPDSVANVGDSAFEDCSSLVAVALPASMKRVGNSTFKGCSALASVSIPSSVEGVGDRAFEGCPIQNVYYAGTSSQWKGVEGLDVSGLTLSGSGAATVHYKSGGAGGTGASTGAAHQHTAVKMKAVAATIKKTGLTEGSKCSVCGEVLVAQKTVPKVVLKPKATKIKKIVKAKKKLTVKWAKQTAKTKGYRITGYQVRYSVKANMKGAKKTTIKGYKKTSVKISKLKAKKKYYVQVRTYVKASGKTFYSAWSATKSAKTK